MVVYIQPELIQGEKTSRHSWRPPYVWKIKAAPPFLSLKSRNFSEQHLIILLYILLFYLCFLVCIIKACSIQLNNDKLASLITLVERSISVQQCSLLLFFFFLEVVLATIAASTLMENNPSSSRTDRKTIERNRRNQMKALYSQLNSLVPHQSSRVSIPPSILFTRYCCTLPNMKALL